MEHNQLVQGSLARLKQKFILINKIRIRTWQGTLIIGFAAGFAAAFMWSVSQQWVLQLKAAAPHAELRIIPSSGSFNVGDEFDADIVLNTDSQNAVAVGAYLTFDSKSLQVLSVDYKNSVFPTYGVEDVNVYDNAEGVIKITRGEPTPGVNTIKGIVATVHFKALSVYESPNPNVRFITVAVDKGKVRLPASSIHLDDGLCPPSPSPCSGATDILGNVRNAVYTITNTKTHPPKTSPKPRRIKVKIIVEGLAHHDKVVTLYILEKGTENVVKDITITPGREGEGSITVPDLDEGRYDIRIKTSRYLSRKLTDIVLSDNDDEVRLDVPTFFAGNLKDDDDTINSLDWSIMNGKWGTDDSLSDINEDKIVNSLDWSIMNTNWGKSGE